MVGNAGVVAAVAAGLARHGQTNVVLDPVMVATSGDRLLEPDAIEVLRTQLLPRALLITPNLPEAAALLDVAVATDESQMHRQADRLLALGARAVLMKGGHAEGDESTDILFTGAAPLRLAAKRIATRNTHGTGCTLSAAIAAGLAKGQTLEAAVRAAKQFITDAIAAADRLAVGSGRGPVHHFYKWW
jgi:hydroxymethylpyrimidine/phosphomethylpyrimidine kinase